MECISKVTVPDPIAIKEQGYGTQQVPCGSCLFCLANRRSEWSFRLGEEQKDSLTAYFITLTYDPETLPHNKYGEPTLFKRDLQKFWKRLREKQVAKHYKNGNFKSKKEAREHLSNFAPIKYYSVGEYGSKGQRPHYHAIVYNVIHSVEQEIESLWGMGMVDVQPVNPHAIHYVTGYVMQKDSYPSNSVRPYNAMSNGLGQRYMQNAEYHTSNKSLTVRAADGSKQKLPRYYREKMFTKEQTHDLVEELLPKLTAAQQIKIARLRALGNLDIPMYEYEQREAAQNKIKKSLTKKNKL